MQFPDLRQLQQVALSAWLVVSEVDASAAAPSKCFDSLEVGL